MYAISYKADRNATKAWRVSEKNIIAFPHKLQEVKQMCHLPTNLNIDDLVDAALADGDREVPPIVAASTEAHAAEQIDALSPSASGRT